MYCTKRKSQSSFVLVLFHIFRKFDNLYLQNIAKKSFPVVQTFGHSLSLKPKKTSKRGELHRTITIIRKTNIRTGKDLALVHNMFDVTLLADIVEKFIEPCCEGDRNKQLYFESLPDCTSDAGLKHTKNDL